MDCCGTCKKHDTGYRDVNSGGYLNGSQGGYDFRGHGNHPNGKCKAVSGRYAGVVTGYFGACGEYERDAEKHQQFAPTHTPAF